MKMQREIDYDDKFFSFNLCEIHIQIWWNFHQLKMTSENLLNVHNAFDKQFSVKCIISHDYSHNVFQTFCFMIFKNEHNDFMIEFEMIHMSLFLCRIEKSFHCDWFVVRIKFRTENLHIILFNSLKIEKFFRTRFKNRHQSTWFACFDFLKFSSS